MAAWRAARAGFTLVEALVVMAILAVLSGLAMVAVNLIRARQAEVRAVHELENVASAVTAYLSDYPLLGDPPASAADIPDFARRPLHYLIERPVIAGRTAYIEPAQSREGDAAGMPLQTRAGAVRLLDAFRAPYRWGVVDESVGGKPRFTRAVAILTRRGTPGRPDADIISVWRNEDGRWSRLTWHDLDVAEAVDAGSRTREQQDLVLVKEALKREQALPP